VAESVTIEEYVFVRITTPAAPLLPLHQMIPILAVGTETVVQDSVVMMQVAV